MSRRLRIGIVGDGQLGHVLKEELRLQHRVHVYSRSDGFDLSYPLTAVGVVNANDVIINCAAMTDVDACETARQEAVNANTVLPVVLADACSSTGTKLVHFSTDYVFGSTADSCPTALLDESCAHAPVNFYGETKALADKKLVELISEGELSGLVLRPAWLYSAVGSNFLTKMVKSLQSHVGVKIADDQHAVPTSAYTVARVIKEWLNGMVSDGEYNVCSTFDVSAPPPSRYDIACYIKEQIGSSCVISRGKAAEFPSKAKRQLGSCMSTKKLERELCTRKACSFKLRDWKEDIAEALSRLDLKEDNTEDEKHSSDRWPWFYSASTSLEIS